jgi:type II secretory ATPase GspE/PulE/Tfp pilus assembly ATPase PilB-like protein
MYPNVEPRQHFEDAMRKADIREKNKQWCKYCRQWYYKRDGIYEILDIDDTVAKYLQDYRKSLSDLDTFVITKWHIKIKMYGALRVLEWKIDWEDLISKVR